MTHPTKLTLRLDSGLIESAKAFAREHERSLSQLVADYFARLGGQPAVVAPNQGKQPRVIENSPLGPVTTSLRGSLVASGSKRKGRVKPLGIDDYHAYLEEKYK